MALLTIGTGDRIGDFRIIGNGHGKYAIERRSALTTEESRKAGEKDWVEVGSADTTDAALVGLQIIMDLEYKFLHPGPPSLGQWGMDRNVG